VFSFCGAHTIVSHWTEGVTVEKPGPLAGLASAFCSALNQTGEALLQMGYRDMAQFVIHTARYSRWCCVEPLRT
ncbi:unnamed protein product, partial [Discosporangium mesarthrocarpum]